MSKSRVPPLKNLPLPKLKLMAASICTRLTHLVAEALKLSFSNIAVHRWSLCEIVLHWLHSSKPLKQFIANRTKGIKALLPVSVRNHCPTHENHADLLNHGITASLQHSFTPHLFGNMVHNGYHLLSIWTYWNSSICNCVTSPMQKILMPQPAIPRPRPMALLRQLQRRNSGASATSLMLQDLAPFPSFVM